MAKGDATPGGIVAIDDHVADVLSRLLPNTWRWLGGTFLPLITIICYDFPTGYKTWSPTVRLRTSICRTIHDLTHLDEHAQSYLRAYNTRCWGMSKLTSEATLDCLN